MQKYIKCRRRESGRERDIEALNVRGQKLSKCKKKKKYLLDVPERERESDEKRKCRRNE